MCGVIGVREWDCLGQFAARGDVADEDVDQPRPTRLAAEIAFEDGGYLIVPGHLDRCAVAEDDDGPRIDGDDRCDEGIVCLGHAHVLPVEALGLFDIGESRTDHDDVGSAGDCHCGGDAVGVWSSGTRGVALGIADAPLSADTCDERIVEGVDLVGTDHRAACTLVAWGLGKRADDGDALCRGDRE